MSTVEAFKLVAFRELQVWVVDQISQRLDRQPRSLGRRIEKLLVNDSRDMILKLNSETTLLSKTFFESRNVLLVKFPWLVPSEMQVLEPDPGGSLVFDMSICSKPEIFLSSLGLEHIGSASSMCGSRKTSFGSRWLPVRKHCAR